jgi:hypothetical protein
MVCGRTCFKAARFIKQPACYGSTLPSMQANIRIWMPDQVCMIGHSLIAIHEVHQGVAASNFIAAVSAPRRRPHHQL